MSELAVKQENSLKAIMRSNEINSRFAEVVGNNNAGGYISSVLIAVSGNTALQSCSPNSIISSALRAATMRLSVDPSTGQAHIVPFGNKATLIVGWKGIYHMAIRTGKYRFINLITIYDTDDLQEDIMTGNYLITRNGRSTNIVGYMLYFQLLSGFSKTFYMTNEECDAHGQKYSKSYNNRDSMWQKDPPVMFKKTVMKNGLTKWGYLDPFDMMNMTEAEEEEDFITGIEVQEVKPHSVDENMRALGFGDDAPLQDEEPIGEPELEEEPIADVPVKITAKMFWEMAKAVKLSNAKGQDALNNAGGDYEAAYHELKKLVSEPA